MAIGYLDSQYLTDIADAIREKDGTQSTYTPSQMPNAIRNIPGPEVQPKDVTFYDWDGTVLYTYTLAEAHNLTALPPLPPSYKDYTADSWTETLQYVQNLQHPFNIGVNYTTTRTDTKFYITLDERRLDVVLYVFNNNVTVDWGDGTSGTYSTSATHTYSQPGNYVVSAAMRYLHSENYGGSANLGPLYSLFDVADLGYMEKKNPIVTAIELGNEVNLMSRSLIGSYNLTKMLIPYGTVISADSGSNSSTFSYSFLKFISLPSSEVISQYKFSFWGATQLERFVLPSSLADRFFLGQNTFQNCNALKDALLPEVSLTTSQVSMLFTYQYDRPPIYTLERIVVPEGLTNVSFLVYNQKIPLNVRYLRLPSTLTTLSFFDTVFLFNIKEITFPASLTSMTNIYLPQVSHFTSLIPPTATWVTSYNSQIAKIIYVPAEAVEDYKTAWPDFASIIQAEPTT